MGPWTRGKRGTGSICFKGDAAAVGNHMPRPHATRALPITSTVSLYNIV